MINNVYFCWEIGASLLRGERGKLGITPQSYDGFWLVPSFFRDFFFRIQKLYENDARLKKKIVTLWPNNINKV